MKSVLLAFALLGSTVAQAARSIDIAIRNGVTELQLINPSNLTVNYNVICYKSTGGSATTLDVTGETLATNAKKTYTVATVDSGKCASNATPVATHTSVGGAKFHLCSGSTNYAGASALCGTGNSFCFPKATTACTDWSTFCTGSGYWLKSESPTEFKTFCGSYSAVTGGYGVVGTFCGSSGYARKSSSDVEFSNMHEESTSSSGFGAVCCEMTAEYASYCRVTITNSEPAARLISPDFRGGSAF